MSMHEFIQDGTFRPYIFHAFYAWAVRHHYTPQITVDVTVRGVTVPSEYVNGKYITLNISKKATQNIVVDHQKIHFIARFNGHPQTVFVPIVAVRAAFVREQPDMRLDFMPLQETTRVETNDAETASENYFLDSGTRGLSMESIEVV